MIVDGLRTSLGFQNIRVEGVPVNSHFAQVLIEADYRMKLIGLGMEKPAVKMASFVDRAHPSANRKALQRWYFMPDYQCVRVAADSMGMQLVGAGVKLVDEDEVVGSDGSRKATGKSNKASKAFVAAFTQKYAEIAARTPVYAQLRNCIDLAISAAFIQQQDYYGKAGWRMTTFANEVGRTGRNAQHARARRDRRRRRLEGPSVDDADRRRCDDAARQGARHEKHPARRGWQDQRAARIDQRERSARRPVVVGLVNAAGGVGPYRHDFCALPDSTDQAGLPGPVATRWKCSCTSRSTTRRTPSTRQCGSLSS